MSWLTTTQAAALVGVGRHQVWRWAHAGLIPAQHLLRSGNRVRISRAWADQKSTGKPAAEAPCA